MSLRISFVHHEQFLGMNIFGDENERSSSVIFLAEFERKLRLMAFRTDPWLLQGQEIPEFRKKPISVRNQLYLFNGFISKEDIHEINMESLRSVQLLTIKEA